MFVRLLLSGVLAFFFTSCFAQSLLFDQFSDKDGLPDNRVYQVTYGPEGNIWFATAKGISRFNGLSFDNLPQSELPAGSEILGFFTDFSGALWCYSSQGEFFKIDGEKLVPMPVNSQLKQAIGGRIINEVVPQQNGDVWISTVIGGGLYRISNGGSTFEKVALESEKPFRYFIKKIGAASFICGSVKATQEEDEVQVYVNDLPFRISLSGAKGYAKSRVIQLRDGSFLYAKGYEIVNFDEQAVIARAFVEKSVESLLEDSEGKVWIALHQGGIICYPTGNISAGSQSAFQYLGDKTVFSVAEDNTGNIWISTEQNGVYMMPLRPELDYTSPKVYTKTNNKEVENVAAQVTSQKTEALAYSLGPRFITTDTVRYDTIPPSIYISGLFIKGRDTNIQNYYDLASDENFFQIKFAGFAHNHPELMQYKYRMTGVEEDWVYTGNTVVQYTTLPPGKYTFSVSTMNKYGTWSNQPATISFHIKPPYYQTWWFILAAISGGLFVLGAILFLWTRQVKRKSKEKAEINKRIAEVELQALRAQMNPHFMFNTMSSIQHYITINDSESALKYLSKFAKLMRRIMENSKNSVIPIKDEIDAIELYLQLESLRFKNKFDYKVTVDASIDMHYDVIPSMLIQPYVENSILHGMMNKREKGHILVTIEKVGEYIHCIVEDDGIGRDAAKKINSPAKSEHKSRGLSITKERLKILNTTKNSSLNVDITDLKDTAGDAIGTRIDVHIPLNN